MIETIKGKLMVAAPAASVALVPAFAFAEEGGGSTNSAITTAIVNMATNVANDAVSMLAAVVPVLAPIVGAVILATLGYKFVRRFSK